MPQHQLPYDILQYIVGVEESRPEQEKGREFKLPPMDELAAMEFLLDKLKATKSNAQFFESMKRQG